MGRERLGAYGAWAAVCFFWGTTYLAIAVGLESFQPTLFAGLRFVIAGGVLFFVMSRQRGARLPQGREWFDLGVVGLMLLGIGNGAVVWAELWVPSGMAALLVATSPFWVVGIERLRAGGERVGAEVDGYFLLGAVLVQIGCVTWSVGSVYSKGRPTGVKPLMAAAVQMLIAGVALTLAGTALGEWGQISLSGR